MRNPCAFTLSLSLSLSLALALASIGFLGMPLTAQASVYLPGATTNPDCAPTDPPSTCGISTIVASSTANSVPYYAANGSTLSATSTFQILANGTASTTNLIVVNSLTLGTLSGFLKATAGAIATALINLASDVTGILPVANGGTGWAALQSGTIPYGNGTSALATTSAGTNGQVLALVNGVPTWQATTTLATISGTLNNAGLANSSLTVSGTSGLTGGGSVALGGSTSLSLDTAYANTFTALQQFNGNASTTGISSTYASSTNAFFGNLSIGSLSGFLKATAGAIATALVNLASDVTGILPVSNGGTGVASIASGYIPFGNNTGAIATSTALYFDSINGRLGIGTSTPWAQLSVNPNGITGPSFAIGSSTATSFIVTNGGFVGIGTTSPFTTLSVVGNGYFSGSLNVGDSATTRSNLGLTYATGNNFSNIPQVATWGDSITFGIGGASFPSQLARLYGYSVYNGGVTSETSTQIKTRMLADSTKYTWPTIIWAGRNDYSNAATVEANIASMVSALTGAGNTNYLVMGIVTASSTSEYTGQANNTAILALNSALSITYGAKYFDVLTYLLNSGLSDAGIATTSDDQFDVNNGIPPGSLRYDSIHYNTAGNMVIAQRIASLLSVAKSTNNNNVLTSDQLANILNSPPVIGGVTPNIGNFSVIQIDGINTLYASSTTGSLFLDQGGHTLMANSTVIQDTAIGYEVLDNPLNSGAGNTGVGYRSLQNNTTGYWNSAVGLFALQGNTTGYQNIAVGMNALPANTTGYNNTAIGVTALYTATSSNSNTAVGYQALLSDTTGSVNTALGSSALRYNTTGQWNSAVGVQALYSNTTGSNNTAVGSVALYTATSSDSNTAIGMYSLYSNTVGSNNSALGFQSLKNNTTGNYNTANGLQALYSNTTGSNNTAVGSVALYTATSSNSNTAIGMYSLYYNTVGASNSGLGFQSLYHNTTGNYNTASGLSALSSNTTGSNNSSLGGTALLSNTTGSNNSAFGFQTLYTATSSSNNTSFGANSLTYNTIGANNSTLGASTLFKNTTGSNNTAIGFQAGYGNGSTVNMQTIVDTNSLFLGYQASRDGSISGATALTNATAIGYLAKVAASNSMILGGTGANAVEVGIGTTTPYALLSISNSATTVAGTPLFVIASTTGGNSTTTVFSVASTGDVTINGSYGVPCVIGNSNGATMCSSDERLKTNITVIPNALHDIEQIKGVTFNWADPTKNQSQFIGVIAQDVQKVFPQAVAMLPNGFLGVDYATLVAPLIEAVKEIGAISGEFKSNLIAWLGNATNGITDFFATNGHFSNELCVGSTCVTESQLKTILQSSGQQASPPPATASTSSPQANGVAGALDVTATSTSDKLATDATSTDSTSSTSSGQVSSSLDATSTVSTTDPGGATDSTAITTDAATSSEAVAN